MIGSEEGFEEKRLVLTVLEFASWHEACPYDPT